MVAEKWASESLWQTGAFLRRCRRAPGASNRVAGAFCTEFWLRRADLGKLMSGQSISSPLHNRSIHGQGGVSLRWRVLAGNATTGLLAVAFAVAVAWSGWSDLRKREQAGQSLAA